MLCERSNTGLNTWSKARLMSTTSKDGEKRSLWPAASCSSSQFGRSVQPATAKLGALQKPRFSFDWTRGREKGKEQSMGYLSSWGVYGEGLPFSSRQRWKHFVALLLLSGFFFVLAGAFLPLVLVRPQKFCLFFTTGSLLNMASFAVLRGPMEQLKHMFSVQRCVFPSLDAPPFPDAESWTHAECWTHAGSAGFRLLAPTSAPWRSPSTPPWSRRAIFL